MADINAYVRLTSGTGPGPYNIYYRDATNNNALVFFEGPLTLQNLYDTRIVTVPDTTKTITVQNVNPACSGFSKDVDIIINPVTPTITPTNTVTATPNASLTPTPTTSPTTTPAVTSTPSVTGTPVVTPTITPTPSTPLVAIALSLTIDAGNSGYTRLYSSGSSGPSTLITTLSTTTSTTVYVPAGNMYFVQTVQQSRQFDTEVAQINNYINGVADSCSPYIQTTLNTILELNCPAQYTPKVYPTLTYGNTYIVNTFIGGRRPV